MSGSEKFPATFAFHDLLKSAREEMPHLYGDWCSIADALKRLRDGPEGDTHEHLTANVDLILRKLESEQSEILRTYKEYMGGGTLFLQISLSQMWLTTIYDELRRAVRNSICSISVKGEAKCGLYTCFRCKVVDAKEISSRFRIPISKLENERSFSTREISLATAKKIFADNGSVGWSVYSDKHGKPFTSSRLEVSDQILQILR